MKNGMFTIFRKELARFFGDKRTALGTILLPGVLIFAVYTFMGSALSSQFSVDEDFVPVVQAVALPDSLSTLAGQAGLEIQSAADVDQAKTLIADQELDLLAVFPSDFDAQVSAYDVSSGAPAPAVELYYNSASVDSSAAYEMMYTLLDSYESSLSNKFDVNPGSQVYDLATDADTAGTFLSSMMPMLLMLFLFSGCMATAPESIAGEKERGTIATLLITPLKRSDLALGKIFALSIIALLSGLSSTIGTLLSMPALMQLEGNVGAAYTPVHYLALCLIILSTVLFLVACISLISAFAKTIKEAQTYVTPLMILAMVVGVTAMFGGGASANLWAYFIPFYNSVQAMVGIFALELNWTFLLVAVVSNLVYTAIGVWGLTRMFGSEKIMFQR
ncbi:MAG TPA: ABC transporter permease [Candidatus Enterenecus stercoripullorum]|nr:ABC transporter permease [Candidatus Enterenecus stercoripullorum]